MGRRAISRALSIERRLEKTRSWKRCSVGSSNSSARNRSLESGVMLWRLNHALLPDPGNPIANTTVPRDGRGAGATAAAGSGEILASGAAVAGTALAAVAIGGV
jgi:hypothetical protein